MIGADLCIVKRAGIERTAVIYIYHTEHELFSESLHLAPDGAKFVQQEAVKSELSRHTPSEYQSMTHSPRPIHRNRQRRCARAVKYYITEIAV